MINFLTLTFILGICIVSRQVIPSSSSSSPHSYFQPGTNHRSIKVTGSQNQVQVALSIVMAKLHGSS